MVQCTIKYAVTPALIEKAHTYAAVQVDVNMVTIKHVLTLMSVPAIKKNSQTFSTSPDVYYCSY